MLRASATPRSLFGFAPEADLIGHSLASFVNLFEDFRVQQPQQQQLGPQVPGRSAAAAAGADQTRFSQLALDIGPKPEPDDAALLTLLAQAAQQGGGAFYRVGVRARPLPEDQIGQARDQHHLQQQQQQASAASVLLAAVSGSHRLRPALLRVDVIETDWLQQHGGNVSLPELQFQVQLWSVEQLRAVLEVDGRLKVTKANPAACQMLGLSASTVQRKLLSRCARVCAWPCVPTRMSRTTAVATACVGCAC